MEATQLKTGTVVRLNDRGFGFLEIHGAATNDVFFHASKLIGVEFADLQTGDKVTFDTIRDGERVQAFDVRMCDD